MATQRRSGGITINPGTIGLPGVTSGGFQVDPSITESVKQETEQSVYNPIPGSEEVTPVTPDRPAETEEVKQTKAQKLDSNYAEANDKLNDYIATRDSLKTSYNAMLSDPNATMTDKVLAQSLVQNAQRDVDNAKKAVDLLDEKRKKAEEENWWDDALETSGDVLKFLAGGFLVYEGLSEIFGWDDSEIAQLDANAELEKSTKAITNEKVADAILDASYRDMPRTTDLENLANYRNQFGSLSGDFFNDPQMGPALEVAYQNAKLIDPKLSRDQFLVEYADQNPTNPIAQRIRYSMSKMGQLERSSNNLFEIDRGVTLRGLDTARNFYKPTIEGGYGFDPNDFRTEDQTNIVNRAMGLVNDSTRDQLKDRINQRVQTNGRLSQQELSDITSSALTSVDPSLQNQAYIRNGGLARSVLNTGQAQRQRMIQDEGALLGLMAEERNAIASGNAIVNSNTFDPTRAFGLEGSNTGTAIDLYNNNPTQGLNYDPTSSFFSSIIGTNANIANANSATTPISSSINKVTEGLEGIAG